MEENFYDEAFRSLETESRNEESRREDERQSYYQD